MSVSKGLPRVHAVIYPNSGDLELKFEGCRVREKTGGGPRGIIQKFSSQSAKRCLTVFRELAPKFKTMICLTYPEEYLGRLDGRESKRHLDRFILWLKRETTPDLVYAWVLEFQRKGNPHYHILCDHEVDWQKVAKRWFVIVGSGLEKHLNAGTRVERVISGKGAGDYVGRYLGKQDQKNVPEGFMHVGRFWGYARGSIEVIRGTFEYESGRVAKRDTRLLRKLRGSKLKEKCGFRWRWGQNGFTDRILGLETSIRMIGMFQGKWISEEKEVPW